MINKGEEKLYEILEELEIQYVKHEHKAVFTVEEANTLEIDLPGKHCKNLFLRNRKGNIHYLLVLEDHKRVDLKILAKEIGSTALSVASEERLYKYLQLKPGSVTPFGLINDMDREVEVLIDEDLLEGEYVNFHPNVNTATLNLSYKDFEKFIKWCGNKVKVVKV